MPLHDCIAGESTLWAFWCLKYSYYIGTKSKVTVKARSMDWGRKAGILTPVLGRYRVYFCIIYSLSSEDQKNHQKMGSIFERLRPPCNNLATCFKIWSLGKYHLIDREEISHKLRPKIGIPLSMTKCRGWWVSQGLSCYFYRNFWYHFLKNIISIFRSTNGTNGYYIKTLMVIWKAGVRTYDTLVQNYAKLLDFLSESHQ